MCGANPITVAMLQQQHLNNIRTPEGSLHSAKQSQTLILTTVKSEWLHCDVTITLWVFLEPDKKYNTILIK